MCVCVCVCMRARAQGKKRRFLHLHLIRYSHFNPFMNPTPYFESLHFSLFASTFLFHCSFFPFDVFAFPPSPSPTTKVFLEIFPLF